MRGRKPVSKGTVFLRAFAAFNCIMNHSTSKILHTLDAFLDFFLLLGAYEVSSLLRMHSPWGEAFWWVDVARFRPLALVYAAAIILIYIAQGEYRTFKRRGLVRELAKALLGNLGGFALAATILYVFHLSQFSRLQAAYPDWSVRRAFTAQIIINHVQARDGEKIDNMKQALDRAVANGVKNLVVQPTHLMHGAEYDEMCEAVNEYADKFESVAIAEPLLGEVGADATEINADKEAVATAITTEAVAAAGYDDAAAAAADGTAFVFMGHGTSHTAKISYSQMQMTMQTLGYDNVFIGTVEGEPEDTACEAVIEKIKEAGYTKVVLRPLMVVAGDHANNDMAGDDADSWLSQFKAAGCFDSVDTQIAGLGEIADVQQIYIDHTKAAIDSLNG